MKISLPPLVGLVLLVGTLSSTGASARCAKLSRGEVKARFVSITPFGASKQCGVELEVVDALKQEWLKQGERGEFWSEDPAICGTPIGTERTLNLMRDCCDAIYDWCTAQWTVRGKKKEAHGRRIWSEKGNRTF